MSSQLEKVESYDANWSYRNHEFTVLLHFANDLEETLVFEEYDEFRAVAEILRKQKLVWWDRNQGQLSYTDHLSFVMDFSD